jgi:2-amino-4-hydroxy-6-hydroxymethyldihydropteridine diphosphokinase
VRTRAYIGLGANLDDPRRQVLAALEELARLPDTELTSRSSLWRSAPVGHADQPEYVNAVACIDTALAADALLERLQAIEHAHGRKRSFANAPRTLDLDLLLYGGQTRDTPRLALPHPRMHERAFVLRPLAEIAPQAQVPGRGPVGELLAGVADQHCEREA